MLARSAILARIATIALAVLLLSVAPLRAGAEALPDQKAPPSTIYQDHSTRRGEAVPERPEDASIADRAPSDGPLPSRQTHAGPQVFSSQIPVGDFTGIGPLSSNAQTAARADVDPAIQKYLDEYATPAGLRWLQNALNRGQPFRDFIVDRLKQAGMPAALYYLALIESTFAVDSVSRSGAVGLWQFMQNSVGDRMAINQWVDERRDFWKSTEAAIEKLKYNYSVLGDWLLAITAYNAGLGFVSRLVDSTGIHDYWTLLHRGLLTDQASVYVPKLLAVAAVASFAGRNGLDVDWAPPTEWVRIQVASQTNLRDLSEQASIPYGLLKMGNAELNTDRTPPGSWLLKVPVRYQKAASEALKRLALQVDH